MNRVIIIGAGGHARVIVDCLQQIRGIRIYGILERDRTQWGKKVWGVPIIGGDDLLPGMKKQKVDYFVVGVGGIGDNRPRQKLFEIGQANGLQPLIVKHPSAVCSKWVRVGGGCQLLANSVVNPGSELGMNVIINTGAIIEHDCKIGAHAHISPGTVLCGGVRVGTGAHIGVGAVVRQGINIGESAIVGAGAVVVKDVLAGSVVAGVPARIMRKAGK